MFYIRHRGRAILGILGHNHVQTYCRLCMSVSIGHVLQTDGGNVLDSRHFRLWLDSLCMCLSLVCAPPSPLTGPEGVLTKDDDVVDSRALPILSVLASTSHERTVS